VQLQCIYYHNLIKVFYANAREENGTIVSRVKGVTITLDDFVWMTITGIQLGEEKSHVSPPNVEKWKFTNRCYDILQKQRNALSTNLMV